MKYKFVEDRFEEVEELDYPEGEVATDCSYATVNYEFVPGAVILSIHGQIFTKDDLSDIVEVIEAMKEKLS